MEFPEFGELAFPYATEYPYLQPPTAHDYSSGASTSSLNPGPFTPSLTVSPLTVSTASPCSPLSVDDAQIVHHTSTPDHNLFPPPSLDIPSPSPPTMRPPILSKRGLRGGKVADLIKVVIEESTYGQLPLDDIVNRIPIRFPDYSTISEHLYHTVRHHLSNTRRTGGEKMFEICGKPKGRPGKGGDWTVRGLRQTRNYPPAPTHHPSQRADKKRGRRSKKGTATQSASTTDLQPVPSQYDASNQVTQAGSISTPQITLLDASSDPQPPSSQTTPDVGLRVSTWLSPVPPNPILQDIPPFPNHSTLSCPYLNLQATMVAGLAPSSPRTDAFATYGETDFTSLSDAPTDTNIEDLFGLFLTPDPVEGH